MVAAEQPDAAGVHPEDQEERDEVRGGWIPEVPDRLRNARWTLSPRHVLVLLAILALGLTVATWTFLRSRPTPIPETRPTTTTPGVPVSQPPTPHSCANSGTNPPTQSCTTTAQPNANQSQPGSNESPSNGTAPNQTQVVVHVAGKVRRPGLIKAPAGSRVADVLALAGGPLRGVDLTTLNLARQVTDGEQIIVGQSPPTPPANAPPATPSTGGGPSALTPVNLNTATLDQLDALPGVGPVLAQRILDYRTQNGPFTTIDQLQEVPGVGPKKFDSLKPHVRL
jgi:competence protein ComEA